MNVVDLRNYLESWPYDAHKNVRLRRGVDGREIILVRQPMGIEQYEVEGRPDGRRVRGMETVLDFHHARINAARQSQAPLALELTAEDRAELFDEANGRLQLWCTSSGNKLFTSFQTTPLQPASKRGSRLICPQGCLRCWSWLWRRSATVAFRFSSWRQMEPCHLFIRNTRPVLPPMLLGPPGSSYRQLREYVH
jgi:hypothetical protein